MTYPNVLPYVTGTAFTDSSGGRSSGDWQTKVMTPVTGDTVTTNQNKLGIVDDQGRVVSLHASAARTVTPSTQTLYPRGALGLGVNINATAITSTPSVVVTIDGFDAAAGTWYNLLTSAAIATVSVTRLVVYPGVTVAANLAVSSPIPEVIRVVATHGNANSITYSVDLDWMP